MTFKASSFYWLIILTVLNFAVHPCYDDSECHEFGHCDGMWCKCNEGYAGDGKDVCEGESSLFRVVHTVL